MAVKKVPIESWEQKRFVEWWRKNHPGHPIISIRNDGSRTGKEKMEQLLMGLHPGAADLYIPMLRCWVEMKRVSGSSIQKNQHEFREYVLSIGDNHIFGMGWEDARQKIEKIIVDKE